MKPLPSTQSGRRDFADWLTSHEHPLTARVFVNRVWSHVFGVGLVRTVDEFGTTGEKPSHPELLDFLAAEFIAKGWSTKWLIRQIVLSRSYGLSSRHTDPNAMKQAAADPGNRLLSRQNRKRLDAEAIRDAMLLVAGSLHMESVGSSIRPGTSTEVGYTFDENTRSVYLPVLRNRLHDLLEVFDFADPNLVVGRRNSSTVSTQALFMLNHPFVAGQSARLIDRLMKQELPSDDARMDWLYRETLGRRPTDHEREACRTFVARRSSSDALRQGAWERTATALFASIDFRYLP